MGYHCLSRAVRAAELGGFRYGDPTDAVHRLRSFPLDLSVRGGNPYTMRKSLSKVRYASKGLSSLLLNPLIRAVLPLVTRSVIWLSVSCFSPLLRKTVREQSTLLHLATFGKGGCDRNGTWGTGYVRRPPPIPALAGVLR